MAASDRESSGTTQDPANTRWQFIDTSDNSRSNLTQVKRHVMQEYIRQKKGSSRNSESDESASRPSERGRRKKPRATKRKYTKKAAEADKDSKQSSPAEKKAAAEEEEDAASDVEEIAPSSMSEVVDPSSVAQTTTLPFHTSQLQRQGFPFQVDDSIDISPRTQSQMTDFHSLAAWSSTPTTPLEFTRSPRTILSAARTDPFNTLPLELDLEGQKLFDFYVNEMPACSYGTHFRSTKAHNWYTKVFVPEAMKGAVAFQNTILVHAANTWIWVRNQTETSNTLIHRDRAITMLREHLSKNPRDNSDVAIISCLSAAALEDFDPRPGHKEISWMHMRAAREMIRSRGGPVAFEHTRLGMLINWQDYILSGYETHGPSFFFEKSPPSSAPVSELSEPPRSSSQPSNHLNSMPSPPESTSSACSDIPSLETIQNTVPMHISSPIDEIRLQCEEFLDFLRRCEQLALYQKHNPEACDSSRHEAVQPISILYQTLAAPSGARFTTSGDRKQMVARLTALMMLNAGLWDYRYTPSRAGIFLKTLEQAMVDSEVSMSGSVEAILQILLECNDGPTNTRPAVADGNVSPASSEQLPDFTQYSPTATSPSARPWFAGRMLKIAKRLNADSWHRLNDFLFSCLTLQVQESSVFSWESDLRREILDAPLTSYIMPSLFK